MPHTQKSVIKKILRKAGERNRKTQESQWARQVADFEYFCREWLEFQPPQKLRNES